MTLAAFVKFHSFVEALAEKQHNLGSDVLEVALTNSAPAQSNTQLSDISQITYTNCSARTVTITSSAQTTGAYSLVGNDLVLTATGGTVGPFSHVVLFNQTSTGDLLIGSWAYGSSVTLQDGETFTIDFGASILTLA
jgi:hypothetical protein